MNNYIVRTPVQSPDKINNRQPAPKQVQNANGKRSFQAVLDKIEKNNINVTKHAKMRLNTRGVSLAKSEVEKVVKAIDQAADKGVKEAVIVVGEQLLIASVTNRTIITAAQKRDMQTKIITNIDGAIFI